MTSLRDPPAAASQTDRLPSAEPGTRAVMKLPAPRGSVSAAVIEALSGRAAGLPATPAPDDEEDLHLALFVCYELAYRGWDGVDDRWEWNLGLLRLRAVLEHRFETTLHELAGTPAPVDPDTVPARLNDMVAADGPSLSRFLRGRATPEEFREFVIHRAVYQLREADPHTFAIPRLAGAAKAALIEIQLDEYGGGTVAKMHQEMFKRTMSWFGLNLTYGSYVDSVGAAPLATNNLMSLFALHRRRRAAILGHLGAYEMTSSIPNRAYAHGLRRLGGDADATAFYDEHVEADAVHEQIAAYDLCGSFAAAEPDLAGDVVWGARCALAVDARWSRELFAHWQAG